MAREAYIPSAVKINFRESLFFAGSLNGKPWEQREFRETLTVLFKYGKKTVWQACEK